jgi:glycosyltransferase involved in cell wall biosynthesis
MIEINILWVGKTGDANAWYHIYPFVLSKKVIKLDVIRFKKPNRNIPEVNFYTFYSNNKVVELFGFVHQVSKRLFSNEYNIVITFNPYPWGIIALILSKIFRKKIVVGLIGGEIEKSRNPKYKIKFILFLFKYVNAITVTGNRMKRNLVLLGIDRKKVFIFPHLTDSKYILERAMSDNRHFNLLTISSFLEVKKTKDALLALAHLHKNKLFLSMCILGDGPLKNEYINLAKDLGLIEYVFFEGYQKDIRPYLLNSDYYLQTSLSEGLSISIVEAMTAGVIPIVTNAGDEKDIIDEGQTGFVLPINSPEKIAEIIISIEQQNLKSLLKRNLKRKRGSFDMKNSTKKIDKLLNFVING